MPAKGFRYPLQERLKKHVRRNTASGCLEWTGQKNRGYGVTLNEIGVRDKAHRVFYRAFVGAIPDGQCVLHQCDNPSCVEPTHLFLGSKGDNNRDRHAKRRSRNQHTGPLYRP